MKKYLFIIGLLIAVSCKKNEHSKSLKEENIITKTISEKKANIENAQKTDRPKKSKIIKSKFELSLLFGIWTYDPKGPHADFELTKESFYVVDYDGNGDIPYVINQDTIKVYYSDYISIGIIKNASKDTLKIDWDKNGVVNYVKWKG